MSRIAKKKSSKRAETLSNYHPSMAEKVKFLIIEGGAINRLGHPAWGLVGKLLGVTNETIRQWRKRSGKYYKEEFAKACNEGIAAADAGQVKRGLLNVAKTHIVRETTLELRTVGPEPPPSFYLKADLLEWAKSTLDLELDPKSSMATIRRRIAIECKKRQHEKMVVVAEKRKRHVDVGAAKIVLPNIGPKEERWLAKEGVVHEGQTFAAAMAAALKSKDQPKE